MSEWYLYAFIREALPFVLQPAKGFPFAAADTTVHVVAEYDQCQHYSYHGAPSFRLSLNIDPRITAQMLIRVFTLKICFTGINMPIVSIVKVVLNSIVGHNITSLVVGCLFHLNKRYNKKYEMQCEPTGRKMTGKTYHQDTAKRKISA